MNQITEITRRDIYDLFRLGFSKLIIFDIETIKYTYYGRLEEIDFLKRLYPLKDMPSTNTRYSNAEEEIWQHTINNNDYPYCWVFTDERFKLNNGTDEEYLKFICEIFHPYVRYEDGYWIDFLDEVNRLLKNDGYELYICKKISNRDVYDWKSFIPDEKKLFIPYSIRNKENFNQQKNTLTIKRVAREQINNLIEKYDVNYQTTDENGLNYYTCLSQDVFNDITQFYTPKSYNEDNRYIETDNIKNIISSGSPLHVLDVLELFSQYNKENNFELHLNQLLELNKLPIKLIYGKVENLLGFHSTIATLEPIKEAGLKELLQESTRYYVENNYKIAAEKIWDTLERLKTYYSPTLDKKKSIEKIIYNMSDNQEEFIELFDNEFKQLTYIGNNFRIRHHETTKTNISDTKHYDYFYQRCFSLISTAIQYLD